jgi:type I restriction enzyme S subunit
VSYSAARLGDHCELITKGTTPTSVGLAFSDQGVPFLRVGNISGGNVNYLADTLFIDEQADKVLKRSRILPGDVLLSIAGTIGRSGVVPACAPAMNCNQAVAIIRTRDSIERQYLRHWLESQQAQAQMAGATVTGTIQNLSLTQVGELKVPLPQLPEQRRIAAILNQADALRAKRREALAQLDSLTQSIFIEMFGDPVINPRGFPVASLTDVCHCYSGGTPSKANAAFWDGDVPWFSAKDMKATDLFDSQDHIHKSVTQSTNLKLLPPNTVAIVVRGMILAHTFPVCVLRVPATINQDLKALIPRRAVQTEFLAYCLRSQSKAVLEKVSEAGHGTKRLDTEGLRQIKVLLPAEGLQQTFANRSQAIESLKVTLRSALAESDALFASLQHRAFAGQL